MNQSADDIFPDYTQPKGPFIPHVYVAESLEGLDLSTCHLVIILQTSKIHYLLYSPQGKLLRAQSLESTGLLQEDMFLRFVFEKEEVLRKTFWQVDIVLTETPFFLVPHPYRQPEMYPVLARLLLDDGLFPDEVGHYPVMEGAATLVYGFPPEQSHILEYYLQNFRMRHLAGAILHAGKAWTEVRPTFMVMYEGKEGIILATFEEGKLLLCNAYPCRSGSDRLYFLQAARGQLKVNPEKCPILLLGDTVQEMNWKHWEQYAYEVHPYMIASASQALPPFVRSWYFLVDALMKDQMG
ncbi:MAG: DUF3822 family protein [Bacteroidota bacterium]